MAKIIEKNLVELGKMYTFLLPQCSIFFTRPLHPSTPLDSMQIWRMKRRPGRIILWASALIKRSAECKNVSASNGGLKVTDYSAGFSI